MKVKNLVLLVLSLMSLTGCFRQEYLKIHSVNGAEIVEINDGRALVVVKASVENLSGPVVIKKGEIVLSDNSGKSDFCRAELDGKVRLERGSNMVEFPVTVYFSGGMYGLMRLVPMLKNGNTDNMVISGSFSARKGIACIKRSFREPLNNIK